MQSQYIQRNEPHHGLGGLTAIHLSIVCMAAQLGWTDCYTFVSYLYGSTAGVDWLLYVCLLFEWQWGLHVGGLTAIHLSLICMTVRLGWTWLPYICLLFVWQWGWGGLTAIHISLICMAVRHGGLTAIHLSFICMAAWLGWTDCHKFVSSFFFFFFFGGGGGWNICICSFVCFWPTAALSQQNWCWLKLEHGNGIGYHCFKRFFSSTCSCYLAGHFSWRLARRHPTRVVFHSLTGQYFQLSASHTPWLEKIVVSTWCMPFWWHSCLWFSVRHQF